MRTWTSVLVLIGLLGALSTTGAEGSPDEAEAMARDGSFETCSCEDLTQTCICTKPDGFIVQNKPALTGKYQVDIGTPSSLVVFFRSDEIPTLSSLCNIKIGDIEFKSKDSLQEENFVVVDTDSIVQLFTYQCNEIRLMYYTFPKDFNKTVTVLEGPSGNLLAPPDQTGYFSYQPMVQCLWILEVGPVGSHIDMTLNWINLGTHNSIIHDYTMTNVSNGDFLLIGAGQDVLAGRETMFFGRRENPQRIAIPSNVAHVFFYSLYSFYNTTGFNITYTSTGPQETDPPLSTTTTESPPAPVTLETNAIVAINGLPVEEGLGNIPTFRRVMAEMSSDYVKENGIAISTNNVTYKMVQILHLATCNPFHCQENCIAFNFSVGALDPKGDWVFTKEVLVDMLQKKDIQDYYEAWAECDEGSQVVSWIYILTAICVVVAAAALSLAVWRCSSANRIKDSRLAYEQQEKQKRDDMRRRSSGDISMIGIGGSISSRGSMASRRFTMPFPKPGRTDEDEDDDLYDMSNYKEYDPDLGRVDPQEFGLQKEFLTDLHAVTYFTNEAFEGDEDTDKTIFQRQQEQPADLPGTDSEDSDGGAVSFSSFKKKKSPSHFTFSADVHDLESSGETAL
ncbi:uncharacterized protein LOC125031182 [Penaeus chinensis]|uniref:uncharacterized protein LOC125031182 n=1 Tax=Penaeus chinensis TaxID=139456 RepID=UPI001FB7E5B0|nr:uncharacterized protein LOC125031182 [Penaeus chinensis]